MKSELRLSIVLTVLTVLGCGPNGGAKQENKEHESPTGVEKSLANASNEILPAGYALLFKLLGDEKNLSKVLIVKKESSELNDLVKEISDFAKKAHKDLEHIAKRDGINLEHSGLPPIESATRERIGKEKGKQLLSAKGAEFEFALLLTQNEGLSYASNLARTIAEAEANPTRKGFLMEIAVGLEQLHGRVSTMLRKGRT